MFQMRATTGQIRQSQLATFLDEKLKPHLPYSLPLYRRCQYDLTNLAAKTAGEVTGEIWIAIAEESGSESDADDLAEDGLNVWLTQPASFITNHDLTSAHIGRGRHQEWLAAHIDLSNPGETQVWLHGSWEPESVETQAKSQTIKTPPRTDLRSALFEQLFNHIRRDHIPGLSIEPTRRWQNLLDSGKLISVPYRRSKVLFGTISEHLWAYLQDDIVYGRANEQAQQDQHRQTCRTRQDLGYLKYIIPPPARTTTHVASDTNSAPPTQLPPDVHFGPLSNEHLQLMLDRTTIPRTLESLQSLVSVGLFPSDTQSDTTQPIAWGMLSKDGSLASLHTEPAYRGRGLAEHICRNLATLQTSTLPSLTNPALAEPPVVDPKTPVPPATANGIDYSTYLHADVSESNHASRRVCEKLHGTTRWRVGWIEVDLEEATTSKY